MTAAQEVLAVQRRDELILARAEGATEKPGPNGPGFGKGGRGKKDKTPASVRDLAAKTSRSAKTIRRVQARAALGTETLEAVLGTNLDKPSELDALVAMPELERRAKVAEAVAEAAKPEPERQASRSCGGPILSANSLPCMLLQGVGCHVHSPAGFSCCHRLRTYAGARGRCVSATATADVAPTADKEDRRCADRCRDHCADRRRLDRNLQGHGSSVRLPERSDAEWAGLRRSQRLEQAGRSQAVVLPDGRHRIDDLFLSIHQGHTGGLVEDLDAQRI